MTTPLALACGGKGPCCHIGYAHRHCEHCDIVIALHQCAPYQWWQPAYQLRPSKLTGFTYTDESAQTANALPEAETFAGALTEHLCEVK